PYEHYFDEIYYPDGANSYLTFGVPDPKHPDAYPYDKDENHVHPPAAKLFMASFMEVWWGVQRYVLHNFNPAPTSISTISWRWGSLVLGLVIVALTYRLTLGMFKNRFIAFLAAFFVCIDQVEIVQCRIAMLDMYEAFWIMIGLVCTWRYIQEPGKDMKWAWWAAICFAFGVATKWSVMFAMIGALVAVFLLKDREDLNGRNPWIVRLIDTLKVFVMGVVLAVAVYLMCFIPLCRADKWNLDHTWTDFRFYHVQMWNFRHDPKQFHHRYLSSWWEWPLCYRPIWYIYHEEPSPNYSFMAHWPQEKWFQRVFARSMEQSPQVKWVYGAICLGSPWTWLFFLLFLLVVSIRMALSLFFLFSTGAYTRPPPTDPDARIAYDEWRESWQKGDEKGLAFCVLAYLPQVLLWSMNPGFMFYMLPVVPLMCILTAHTVADWREMAIGRVVMTIFIVVAVLWTVVYYPLLIGYPIPKPYFEACMLIRNWI
ncbi:MAG TPA: phospholipid carrier-dependent glycosyltransferase, partial [Candidatus Xenobia bacterium]